MRPLPGCGKSDNASMCQLDTVLTAIVKIACFENQKRKFTPRTPDAAHSRIELGRIPEANSRRLVTVWLNECGQIVN
jgi:hypothetical protein